MPGPCCVAFPSFTRPQQDAVGVLGSTATELPPPVSLQVQGVGSRGWRDVTTFFSGRAEDPSDRYARPPVLTWASLPQALPAGSLGGSCLGDRCIMPQGFRGHSAKALRPLEVQRGRLVSFPLPL